MQIKSTSLHRTHASVQLPVQQTNVAVSGVSLTAVAIAIGESLAPTRSMMTNLHHQEPKTREKGQKRC